MKISDASKQLSQELDDYVSDSFVRFYDKNCLGVERTRGNQYRDLNEDDIKKLKKIWVLSKIGIPVKVIRDYISDIKESYETIGRKKKELIKILEGGLLDEFE